LTDQGFRRNKGRGSRHSFKFRLELDVVIDTDAAPSVIEAARQHYAAEGAVATVDQHGADRTLLAEEFIGEIEAALMELSERNRC
jgi:hypothetical protein